MVIFHVLLKATIVQLKNKLHGLKLKKLLHLLITFSLQLQISFQCLTISSCIIAFTLTEHFQNIKCINIYASQTSSAFAYHQSNEHDPRNLYFKSRRTKPVGQSISSNLRARKFVCNCSPSTMCKH